MPTALFCQSLIAGIAAARLPDLPFAVCAKSSDHALCAVSSFLQLARHSHAERSAFTVQNQGSPLPPDRLTEKSAPRDIDCSRHVILRILLRRTQIYDHRAFIRSIPVKLSCRNRFHLSYCAVVPCPPTAILLFLYPMQMQSFGAFAAVHVKKRKTSAAVRFCKANLRHGNTSSYQRDKVVPVTKQKCAPHTPQFREALTEHTFAAPDVFFEAVSLFFHPLASGSLYRP